MSTVSPATTRELAAYHASRGSVMVAAPVFGRPNAAQAKQLRICVSGPADAKAKVKPILEAMGQEVFDFGDNVGAANVVKLAGNFMIAAALEAMGEAVAMMRKSGVDPSAALEMLTKTLFAAPVYQGYGALIAHGRFTPAGISAAARTQGYRPRASDRGRGERADADGEPAARSVYLGDCEGTRRLGLVRDRARSSRRRRTQGIALKNVMPDA